MQLSDDENMQMQIWSREMMTGMERDREKRNVKLLVEKRFVCSGTKLDRFGTELDRFAARWICVCFGTELDRFAACRCCVRFGTELNRFVACRICARFGTELSRFAFRQQYLSLGRDQHRMSLARAQNEQQTIVLPNRNAAAKSRQLRCARCEGAKLQQRGENDLRQVGMCRARR